MIPPEYIDWGAGSPADRRKLIGEIYSQIKKAAGFARPPRFPASSPAARARSDSPDIGAGLPFKNEQQGFPDRNNTPAVKTLLRCFAVAEGRRAAKIINKPG